MALPATFRWRCASIAVVLLVLVADVDSAAAQATAAPYAVDSSADSQLEGPILPAAAQIGSAAEATPDVPDPPSFQSPQIVAGLPPVAEPALSLKKVVGRFSMLAGKGNDLGMEMLDGEAAFKVRGVPELTLGASAGAIFLDGPTRTDLPGQLFATQFDVKWAGQIATPVFYEIGIMPAIFTDGDNLSSDALRLQAQAVGYLAFSEQTQVALGGTYLDRDDVPFLPIFGLLHRPNDDLKLELVFPKPRILGRVARDGDAETWAYVAGELGGGSWAIERRNGRDDIASYRDYRLLVGLEQKRIDRWAAAIEAGYVFGRDLEYESHRGDYSPDNTFLLRLALSH